MVHYARMTEDEIRDDIDFEPEEELGDVGAAQAKIKKLREQLKEAQAKRDEYLDGWQRSKADGVNARRELLAQSDKAHARGKETIFEELIPVLDSFDMAATGEAWESVNDSWRSGMDMIRNQLLDILSRHGIERYGKVGERFDHALHEALQEVDDTAGESGEVVRIIRYGYKTSDRILRPAQVIVKR